MKKTAVCAIMVRAKVDAVIIGKAVLFATEKSGKSGKICLFCRKSCNEKELHGRKFFNMASTLRDLYPVAQKVARKLKAESNIKKVLSAGVLALADADETKRMEYYRRVTSAEKDSEKKEEVRQAVDTLRSHIEFLGTDAAAKLDELFAMLGPDEAARIRTAANALGPAAIAEGQADDDERAAAQAAAADVERTRDDNPLKLRKSS